MQFLNRRALLAPMLLLLGACGPRAVPLATHPLGAKIQVGKLVYHVVEAEWRGEIPGAKNPPRNRVLQVTLSVTNSGSKELSFPMLRLIGADSAEHGEVAEIEDNPRWFGLLRRLNPALTENGILYFDVPVGAYKLEIVDNSDADREESAYIEIPASLAPPPVVPSKTGE